MHHGSDQTYAPARGLDLPARLAARKRYWAALGAVSQTRTAFERSPDDVTAERVRQAEIELDDAIAVAGEFQVPNLPWGLG